MNIVRINDFNSEELNIYARLNETQLLHYNEPELGLFVAESPNVIKRALEAGYEAVSVLCEERYLEDETRILVEALGEVPVYVADLAVLTQITGFAMTRGLLCVMRRKQLPSAEDVIRGFRRVVILEDVVNPTNVGAIFRSAAALNMDAVLLTPACADPLYRRATRVSMGTVFQIPWTYINELTMDVNIGREGSECSQKASKTKQETGMQLLHRLGYKTVAMALLEDSVNIDDEALNKEEKLAVIMGTEGEGLKVTTIESCDYTVCIPMSHGVDSLNVAAASAVAFYELGKR